MEFTEVEEILFKLNYNTYKKDNINIHSWIYYKEKELCILSNERGNFTIKNQNVNINKYYVKFIEKKNTIRIHFDEIENEIKYIKESHSLCDKSDEIIKYISNEIGLYNSCNCFENIWVFKKELNVHFKILISKYDLVIKLFKKNKQSIITFEELKVFLKSNKSEMLKIVEKNTRLYNLKSLEFKKQECKDILKKQEENKEIDNIVYHDATRKVGSKGNPCNFYLTRTLKERYESQAMKPLPTKYEWKV